MGTQFDESAMFLQFAEQAKSPDVAKLFVQLASRAKVSARMSDEFVDGIIRHREARTGRQLRYSRCQQEFLDEYLDDSDQAAEKGAKEIGRIIAKMDDKTLLMSALSSECDQLDFDEHMLSSFNEDDREMAQRIIEFRRETIGVIQQFMENSPFKS
jgi:hypothetical protein